MAYSRLALKQLTAWSTKTRRKPLILRGARQVGKTTLIREFSQQFDHYIELNLERVNDAKYFEDFDDVTQLVQALFLEYNLTTKDNQNTLLFIDEIQEVPKAISALRYFFEDVPELCVVAAGSLLEHVTNRVQNFPVGRVEHLYLHPMNFEEYLQAKGMDLALEALKTFPISPTAHTVLKNLFHEYVIVGGMPEVIQTYLESNSLLDLPPVYESIWHTYKEDVEKYANTKSETRIIRHILQAAPAVLDQRITFQNFGKSNYKSREVGEAFRALHDARIIQLIYPTTDLNPPVVPDFKKSPRLQFLDTGILNHELKIQGNMLRMDDLGTAYKGAIIPHVITQELISKNTTTYSTPNFWVRDKNQSSAEVDLVTTYGGMVIPIEIKSGAVGKLRSLHEFMKSVDHHFAVRIYAGLFSIEKQRVNNSTKKFYLMNLPYYLIGELDRYIEELISKYNAPEN